MSASWRKRFSDYLVALLSLKKARVQRIFFLSQLNYSGARCKYSIQELKKARLELCLLEKSGRERSFGLAHCLDGATRTERGKLTGRGGVDTGGEKTVGAGGGPVMS